MNNFPGKSWFVIDLYTPTPSDVTHDYTYVHEELQCVDISMTADFVYNEEVCNYMSSIEIDHVDYTLESNESYIVEQENSSYTDDVEVIHIER